MGARGKESQRHAAAIKQLRIPPLLLANKPITAPRYRDREGRHPGLANRIHQVFILRPQVMAEDAQRTLVAEQLLIAERQIVRTADGLELLLHLALTDKQRHIVQGLDRVVDRKTAEQGAVGGGQLTCGAVEV